MSPWFLVACLVITLVFARGDSARPDLYLRAYEKLPQLLEQEMQQDPRRNDTLALARIPAEDRVFFVHLPKCAGTVTPELIWSSAGRLRIWDATLPSDMARQLVTIQGRQSRYIYGHIPYGMHLLLRAGTAEPLLPHHYATLLREPVDRVVSHYYYHRARMTDPNHVLAMTHSLVDWLHASPSGSNRMVQFLAGAINVPATRESLALAQYHLRRCSFVGLLERYDDSLQLLSWQTGMARRSVTSKRGVNANALRPRLDALSNTTLQAIREANQLDLELYATAQQIFAQRWQAYRSKT